MPDPGGIKPISRKGIRGSVATSSLEELLLQVGVMRCPPGAHASGEALGWRDCPFFKASWEAPFIFTRLQRSPNPEIRTSGKEMHLNPLGRRACVAVFPPPLGQVSLTHVQSPSEPRS